MQKVRNLNNYTYILQFQCFSILHRGSCFNFPSRYLYTIKKRVSGFRRWSSFLSHKISRKSSYFIFNPYFFDKGLSPAMVSVLEHSNLFKKKYGLHPLPHSLTITNGYSVDCFTIYYSDVSFHKNNHSFLSRFLYRDNQTSNVFYLELFACPTSDVPFLI